MSCLSRYVPTMPLRCVVIVCVAYTGDRAGLQIKGNSSPGRFRAYASTVRLDYKPLFGEERPNTRGRRKSSL